jgi:hypothetical protein
MRVEMLQAYVPEDLGPVSCCACGLAFLSSVAEVHLLTDARENVGKLCLACLAEGPEHIERAIQRQAWWAQLNADFMQRAAGECVEDCPTVEQYLALEGAIGEPRYGSLDKADRAEGYVE